MYICIHIYIYIYIYIFTDFSIFYTINSNSYEEPHNITYVLASFNLSEGCFGPTLFKISPNGQIWDFTGSRYDHSAPNYVSRLFYFEKIKKNHNMVKKNTKLLIFVKKTSLRSYMPNPKVGKNKS